MFLTAESISDSRDSFASLFLQHPEPMWLFDVKTLWIVASNQAAHQIYGYSAAEFRGLRAEALIARQDLARFYPLWAKLQRGESVDFSEFVDFRHLGKGEKIHRFETTWTRVAFQQLTAILIVIHPTPVAKRLEQKQVQETADFLDYASDAIVLCDLDGTITSWNEGATRLYGWSKDEALGSSIMEMLMKNSPVLAAVHIGVRENGEWKGELCHTSRNGQKLIVNSRWTLVRDEKGEPKSILVINTDLTETKRLEAQFLRAQRMESIGTLASGIAHDLNNILSPIIMSVGLLRRTMNAPEHERMLGIIENSAERGAGIVKQVLTFARGIEGERVLLQPKHLMNEVVKIAMQTFPKNIDVRSDFPTDLWMVTGDSTQIHQVLLNLCVNARDAMIPAGGTLRIAAENIEVDQHYVRTNAGAQVGAHVVFKVTDSGCGMSPATIEKIFDPFFTTKEVGKGTGLGLATVMGIVKSHRGFLTVQSEIGAGTTFRIYIPASRDKSNEVPVEHKEWASLHGRGELILVVDDEAPIRDGLVQTLQDYGYRAYTAEDGSDALALYVQRSGEFDLVLTDLAMAVIDGITLVRSLRRYDPKARVVVSSGQCDTEQMSTLKRLGVHGFLDKPYNATKLLQTLRNALDGKGAWRR